MSNETYIDLELHANKQRYLIDMIADINKLIIQYSNDAELGNAIRQYFIKISHDSNK